MFLNHYPNFLCVPGCVQYPNIYMVLFVPLGSITLASDLDLDFDYHLRLNICRTLVGSRSDENAMTSGHSFMLQPDHLWGAV